MKFGHKRNSVVKHTYGHQIMPIKYSTSVIDHKHYSLIVHHELAIVNFYGFLTIFLFDEFQNAK